MLDKARSIPLVMQFQNRSISASLPAKALAANWEKPIEHKNLERL